MVSGAEGAADGEAEHVFEDDPVNPKHALFGSPIVGTKIITHDSNGPEAMKPKLLPTPKGMTDAEWAEHCVTHVKYHPA